MADGLSGQEPVVRSSGEHAAPAPVGAAAGEHLRTGARRPGGSPHSRKFAFATAMLAGIAVAALAVSIIVLLGPSRSSSSSPTWSLWRPPDGGLAGEQEIAAQVAPFYRSSPAAQLAVVTVQNIASATSGTTSSTQLAVRNPTSGAVAAVSGNSAVYNLCGLGPNCTITPGPPSHARLLLLQREAIELALYTFKYVDSVQNVVVTLPPGRATVTCTGLCSSTHSTTTKSVDLSVVFSRASLARFTSRPLNQTLPELLPPTVAQIQSAPEAELVNVIASQALFQQQLVQAQNGSTVVILSPVPPQ
ncbi:MAG: hypothetical protein M3076_07540 [Actinomycetota bacterium]|nr:hypothetical protein [Actinomycetota bacterium]